MNIVGGVLGYFFFTVSVRIVLMVWDVGVVVVGVAGVVVVVWAMYRLCCVFFHFVFFVLVCGILFLFLLRCVVYYRVPCLHCRVPGPRYLQGPLCPL